ncbi:MAG TPA: sodium/proton-translocating pyrophosphatase, partial [Oligoflexia bacterium]|nr:sodium/proton-translocating pyrophosphatase [Oligoflexia bacterium]
MRRMIDSFLSSTVFRRSYLPAMLVFFAAAFFWPIEGGNVYASAGGAGKPFEFFSLFSDPDFTDVERYALLSVLVTAILGLLYAWMLVGEIRRADQGTKKMQEIAEAVREGAKAYLGAQFSKIGPLIIVITLVLFFTYQGAENAFRWGRAGAFLMGSIFSWL